MRDTKMTTIPSRAKNGLLPGDTVTDSGDFEALYALGEYINSGTYGKVYKCRRKTSAGTTDQYAVKIQDVSKDDANSYSRTSNEARIWKSIAHKNITKLHRCFQQRDQFYFVMEFIPGHNLFDEILKRMQYTEKDACFYIRQVLSALAYLHGKNIVHRDIKPDNIMVLEDATRGGATVVKLIDFGLSRRLGDSEERMKCSYSGAPLYLAPETILGLPLGYPVDIWSCGVILYIMLYGTPPFWSEDTDTLFMNIVRANVDYATSNGKESVSFLAKDLIHEMLVKDQGVRMTASEALDHPWFVRAPKIPQQHRRSTIEQLSLFRKCSAALEARYKVRNSIKCDEPLSV